MPIHDWTRADAGIFHALHLKWIAELDKSLNGGLLPDARSGAVVCAHLWPLQCGQANARFASSVMPPLLRGVA